MRDAFLLFGAHRTRAFVQLLAALLLLGWVTPRSHRPHVFHLWSSKKNKSMFNSNVSIIKVSSLEYWLVFFKSLVKWWSNGMKPRSFASSANLNQMSSFNNIIVQCDEKIDSMSMFSMSEMFKQRWKTVSWSLRNAEASATWLKMSWVTSLSNLRFVSCCVFLCSCDSHWFY